jgi:hypothetical protein
VAVGTELAQMNADAEVGLVASDPEAFVVLIPERAAGVDREAFARRLLDETISGLTATRFADDFEATVGGRPLTFAMLDVTWPFPSEMMHAVHFEGDTCVQVLGWYYPTEREAAREALREAFEMVRFLTPSERAALKKDLRATPEPTQRVGPGWCLRDGSYQDFEYGFGWEAPARDLWRIRPGQEARAANEDAQLYLEEPAHGLFGVVIAEPLPGKGGAAFHQLILDNMGGTVFGKREKLRVPGGAGFTSRLDLAFDELELRYHVTTYTVGDRAVQFVLWGLPANVDGAGDAIEAAVGGLTVHRKGLPEVTQDHDRYVDHRSGWSLQLPSDKWSCRSMGDYRMAALGSQVTCSNGEAEVMVVSVQAAQVGQDEAWMEQYAEQLFSRLLAGTAEGTMAEADGTLAGHPSHRLSWTGGPLNLSFEHLVHRQTLYGILLSGSGGRADALRALRDGFELLP